MIANTDARSALAEPYLCCGCGKAAVDQVKPCDCPTMIGYLKSDPSKQVILAALPQVREGWQLVPVQPTELHFMAAHQAMVRFKPDTVLGAPVIAALKEVWSDMLAAAPKPTTEDAVPEAETFAMALDMVGDLEPDDAALLTKVSTYLRSLSADPKAAVEAEREADAFLVEWQRGGETWVHAHADEPMAVDQARKMGGTCTALYRRTTDGARP